MNNKVEILIRNTLADIKYKTKLFYRGIQRKNSSPDFIILGAQKAGTSSIFSFLDKHPRCSSSIIKEIDFFNIDNNYQKGIKWYQQHFSGNTNSLNYECSPYYLYDKLTAKRIKENYPDIKLIICLREPISRAYSAWNMYRELNLNKNSIKFLTKNYLDVRDGEQRKLIERLILTDKYQSFEEYIEEELTNPNFENFSAGINFLRVGIYYDQIQEYYKYFSPSQILILESNKLYNFREETLNQICDFLQINKYSFPNEVKSNNKRNYVSSISDETKDKLKKFYLPHNQKLYELINEKYNWD